MINDWIEETKEYNTDLEAFEYAYLDCCEYGDEEDLADIYEDLNDKNDDLEKINAIKDEFDNVDLSDGSVIMISLEGPGQTYDSGYTKESFESEYDDEEYLDENKKISITEATMLALEGRLFDDENKGQFVLTNGQGTYGNDAGEKYSENYIIETIRGDYLIDVYDSFEHASTSLDILKEKVHGFEDFYVQDVNSFEITYVSRSNNKSESKSFKTRKELYNFYNRNKPDMKDVEFNIV